MDMSTRSICFRVCADRNKNGVSVYATNRPRTNSSPPRSQGGTSSG
jgi:hypothetical protein